MATLTPLHEKIIQAVSELPAETLSELDHFIEYLQFKKQQESHVSGKDFLLSIAGIGESAENERDIAARDESILAQEIDSVRGWTFNKPEVE